MNATEIKAKIEKIRKNKFIPENLKEGQIKKMQAQLDGMDEKPTAKKASKKTSQPNTHKALFKKIIGKKLLEKSQAFGSKITKINFIHADNVKVDIKYLDPRVDRTMTDTWTIKELTDLSNGKMANGYQFEKQYKKTKTKAPAKKRSHAAAVKTYKGKKLTDLDEAECKELLATLKAQREAAATSSEKSRAKPVIEKIAKNLATAVKQAVDDVPAKDAKKAKTYLKSAVSGIKKVVDLLRKAIGDDTKKARVEAIFKELIDLINEK